MLCRLSTGGMAEIFLASQRGLAGFRKLVVRLGGREAVLRVRAGAEAPRRAAAGGRPSREPGRCTGRLSPLGDTPALATRL